MNCGTFAYQDAKRLEFKKTHSHSTVMVNGEEQHECWAPFRVARYSTGAVEDSAAPIVRLSLIHIFHRAGVGRLERAEGAHLGAARLRRRAAGSREGGARRLLGVDPVALPAPAPLGAVGRLSLIHI